MFDVRHSTLNDREDCKISDCRWSKISHGRWSRWRDDWCRILNDRGFSVDISSGCSRVCGNRRERVANNGSVKTSGVWHECRLELRLIEPSKRDDVFQPIAMERAECCLSNNGFPFEQLLRCSSIARWVRLSGYRWFHCRPLQSIPFSFQSRVSETFQSQRVQFGGKGSWPIN